MKHLLSCEFNLDTACVELCFSDGSMVSIDTIAVENEVVNNMYQQSELDYLIYNDPAAYADLILNGDPAVYLKTVTEYQTIFYKGIMPSEKVLDFPVDCNTLTGSVNL